jgi:SAM-dependent methyltransferase
LTALFIADGFSESNKKMHMPYDPSQRGDHVTRYKFAVEVLKAAYPDRLAYVLDAACGIGYGSNYMAANMSCEVLGVDIDRETVEYAKKKWPHKAVEYFQYDLRRGPYKLQTAIWPFDAVVSFETLEHVDDAPSLVKTFSEVAPVLIASVPNENVTPFGSNSHPEHKRHYTPEEFTDLLEAGGYKIKARYSQKSKGWESPTEDTNGRTLIYVGERA